MALLTFPKLLICFPSLILCAGASILPDPGPVIIPPDGSPPFRTNYRTTITILHTCASVAFSSGWACIHPNVYGYGATWQQRLGVKVRLFVNGLLFPSQSLRRVYYEWVGAVALYREMVRRVDMIRHDDQDTAEENADSLKERTMQFVEKVGQDSGVNVTQKAKEDRRILEAMCTKVLASIFLGLWQISENEPQVARRGREPDNMPPFPNISLQAGNWTIGHAYFIQMGGVLFHSLDDKIHYKDFKDWTNDDIEAFFALKLSVQDLQELSGSDGGVKLVAIVDCLWFMGVCLSRLANALPLTLLEVACLVLLATRIGVYAIWWWKPLNVACPRVISSTKKWENPETSGGHSETRGLPWYLALVDWVNTGDVGLLLSPSLDRESKIIGSPIIVGSSRMGVPEYPVNYYYEPRDGTRRLRLWGDIFPLVAFGAMHGIAWYSPFPTPIERLLWQAACVTPVVLALVLACFSMVRWNQSGSQKSLYWAEYFIAPFVFAARLAFIILPLIQFRDLPPLAHITAYTVVG